MHIAALVLDMDGLMLDTEPLYKAACQDACAEVGYSLDDTSYLKLVGRSTADCERQLEHQFGAAFPAARFRSRWLALWRVRAEHGIPTKPGLFELLSFAETQGLALAVATSTASSDAEFTLQRGGLQ